MRRRYPLISTVITTYILFQSNGGNRWQSLSNINEEVSFAGVYAYTPNVALQTDPKWKAYLARKRELQNQNRRRNLNNYMEKSKLSARLQNANDAQGNDNNVVWKNARKYLGRTFSNGREDNRKNSTLPRSGQKTNFENSLSTVTKNRVQVSKQGNINQNVIGQEIPHRRSTDNLFGLNEMLNIENDSFRSIIVAGGLTFVILAGLAMNMGEDEAGAEILMEEITGKVLSTSLPTNLPAILSIGLGEGLAGFFGTFFVYFTSGRKRVSNDGTLMSSKEDDDFMTSNSGRIEMQKNVVADTEYFFVRSISQPLLAATGLPLEFVKLFSVLLAATNSELVRFSQARAVNEEQSKTNNENASNVESQQFDLVEVFSDLVKWLEYDVLTTDFADFIVVEPKTFGFLSESASKGLIFGAITSLSSQLYGDLLYRYTNIGSDKAREASIKKTNRERINRYVAKSFAGAAIFGVYEGARGPLSNAILEFLSGGVDGCVGSADFDICMETYMLLNEPGASPEAQLRSLLTAIYGIIDRVGLNIDDLFDLNFDGLGPIIGNAGLVEIARGAFVSLYSIVHMNAPFLDDLFQFSFI